LTVAGLILNKGLKKIDYWLKERIYCWIGENLLLLAKGLKEVRVKK